MSIDKKITPVRYTLLALLILIGFGLRAALLTENRFHVDEALYATHARAVARGADPRLLTFDVDKPPLSTYLTAAAFAVLGVSEFAARVPNLLASVLSLSVAWALARRMYPLSGGARWFTLLILALSPYDVLFAPTVFAEPQLTLWVLLACRAAVGDRWGWAGGGLALALATKQSALFYIPLVVALGVVYSSASALPYRALAVRLLRLALPLLGCVLLLLLWDAPRGAAHSFWALNLANNAPDRWIRAAEVLPRLLAWGFWLGMFTASAPLNAALLVVGVAGFVWRLCFRARQRAALADVVLVGFILAYGGLLWLRAFNLYDRYIHTLLPLLALLAAHGVVAVPVSRRARGVAAILLTLAMLLGCAFPLHDALAGRLVLGGDKGRYDGIDRVAEFLNGRPHAPGTPIWVCDHWLGWALGFYLGPETAAVVTWYPQPGALTGGVPGAGCYLPVPADAPAARWLRTAERAGFGVTEVYAVPNRRGVRSFTVYRISPSFEAEGDGGEGRRRPPASVQGVW